MRVENNVGILSNREYFTAYCYQNDLCRINRMWLRFLDRIEGRDKPFWEKERLFSEFLESDFDRSKWDYCGIKKEIRDSGTLLTKFKKEVMIYE